MKNPWEFEKRMSISALRLCMQLFSLAAPSALLARFGFLRIRCIYVIIMAVTEVVSNARALNLMIAAVHTLLSADGG